MDIFTDVNFFFLFNSLKGVGVRRLRLCDGKVLHPRLSVDLVTLRACWGPTEDVD